MDHTPRNLSVRHLFLSPTHPPNATHSRFHTRFYVAFLPPFRRASGFSPFSSSTTQHRLPTPDGGGGGEGQQQEVIEARFVHPLQALAEHQAKQIALMPPQHYILTTLADLLVGREAAPHQRERVERLSAGAFGRMVVCPEAVRAGDARGRVALVFEGDEARGGPKGRVHRSLVLFSPETKVCFACALCI